MKLGKTSILALGVGIFLVLLASLGIAYSRQSSERSELGQELDQARLILDKQSNNQLSGELETLQETPAEIDAEVTNAKERLTQSIDDVDVTAVLFKLAESKNVRVMAVHLAKPSSEETHGIDFLTLPVSVTVEGELANLIGYVQGLSHEFTTSLIKSATVEIPEASEEEEAEVPTCKISMIIYTYGEE